MLKLAADLLESAAVKDGYRCSGMNGSIDSDSIAVTVAPQAIKLSTEIHPSGIALNQYRLPQYTTYYGPYYS